MGVEKGRSNQQCGSLPLLDGLIMIIKKSVIVSLGLPVSLPPLPGESGILV